MTNIPVQYERGWVEFFRLKFKVTHDVLIPRPETELLVDEVLSRIKNQELRIKQKNITILDVGTGAGNIAISLAKNLRLHLRGVKLNILATDISAKALKVAKQNAKFHKVEDKILFLQSDLLSSLPSSLSPLPFSLIIVTNLPYVPTQRIPYLDSSVKDFEPHIALDGGKDGFELYRKLFQQVNALQITHRMCNQIMIICEIDYTHGELALNEAYKYFPNSKIEVKKDLGHLQRILKIFLDYPKLSKI